MPKFSNPGEQHAQAHFGIVERFLATDTENVYDTSLLNNEAALQEAYEAVRLRFAPPVVAGNNLLDQIRTQVRTLNFGCAPLDQLLNGAFREAQVLELFGESGSGKTQLCMMACAKAASKGEKVLYIDTSNGFQGNRFINLLIKLMGTGKTALEAAAERVSVVRAYNASTALAALDGVLAAGPASPNRPSIVILDSIGAIIAPILGGGGAGAANLQGHAVLAAAGTLLKQVAAQLRCAVLVTNHVVGGGFGAGADSSQAAKRSALGESWFHQAHCRVQLSVSGVKTPHVPVCCTAMIRSSTFVQPGNVAQFWLTAEGASAQPPGDGAPAQGQ